jgi:uncharacterized SAM-binding protein YcdF (DUF218 family)
MTASILKSPPTRSATWKRRLFWISSGAVVALLLAALACYLFPHQILMVDGGPVKADAMVLLGGNEQRPTRAAELFKQGEAPLIICSGYGDAHAYKTILMKSGVPAQDISLEAKSRSTRENAELSIAMLRQMGARRVIIVTSWYHSRRALMCFEHYAPEIQFYSRPSYYGYPRPEWRSKGINGYIKSEYMKLLGYWVCYGVCPL